MDLPQEFLARMKRMLGEEYEEFLRTYERPRQFGLRVNTLKISVDEFLKLAPFHLRKIPWTDNGFYYEREDDPARHPFYYAGLYYLQEPSAMLPAAVLPVPPGGRVLDLCAAPGGKATALAAKLQGEGLLVANEISASRAKALLKNLEVSGVTNSFVTNTTANRLAEQFPEAFDRILVDAPCSGEGMFRKDPANARAWSPEKVEACAKIQREITLQAVQMLRPGGLLLYSTCTFSAEEDEGTVAYLLSRCPELELLEIPGCGAFPKGRPEYLELLFDDNASGKPGGTATALRDVRTVDWTALGRCVRVFPHRAGGEGHFLALFRRREGAGSRCVDLSGAEEETPVPAVGRGMQGSTVGRNVRGRADGPDVKERADGRSARGRADGPGAQGSAAPESCGKTAAGKRRRKASPAEPEGAKGEQALLEFLRDVSPRWDREHIEVRSGQAYYVPNDLADTGLPFLRNGLYLGELRRGRFEPSQAFAMALRPGEYASVIDFDEKDPRVRRYLCGETVQIDDQKPSRPSGWQLVSVCGCPLGWGKLTGGTLKNKYHPGWRMQS